MELHVWSKTLLNVYGCLNKLTDEIDKIVLNFALNSGYLNGVNKTYKDAQKIIELTQRKITLINIKVVIEECLNKLDINSRKILMLKYVDRLNGDTISNLLNLKKRTYYRKYQQAISKFSSLLLFKGFNAKEIHKLVKEEEWIVDVFKRLLEKECNKNDIEISNISLCSMAFRNYKKENKNEKEIFYSIYA